MNKFYLLFLVFALSFQLTAYGYSFNNKIKHKYKKTISIDLDGVLNNYNGNYDKDNIPEIKEGAKDFIIKLNEKYDLILFTARNSKQAENWLIENDLNKYFKTVTNIKQPSYIYIDDRALKFDGDYIKTLDDIEKFKVHWK